MLGQRPTQLAQIQREANQQPRPLPGTRAAGDSESVGGSIGLVDVSQIQGTAAPLGRLGAVGMRATSSSVVSLTVRAGRKDGACAGRTVVPLRLLRARARLRCEVRGATPRPASSQPPHPARLSVDQDVGQIEIVMHQVVARQATAAGRFGKCSQNHLPIRARCDDCHQPSHSSKTTLSTHSDTSQPPGPAPTSACNSISSSITLTASCPSRSLECRVARTA